MPSGGILYFFVPGGGLIGSALRFLYSCSAPSRASLFLRGFVCRGGAFKVKESRE